MKRALVTCLALSALLGASSPLVAQDTCMLAPANCTVTTPTGTKTECTLNKLFYTNTLTSIVFAMSMNVTACQANPTVMGMTSNVMFVARALTAAPAGRSCSWAVMRTAGTFPCIIDGVDGLPVELLDFGLEP